MHSTHQYYVSLRMRRPERVYFMSSPSYACARVVDGEKWVASSSLPVFSAVILGGAMYHFAGMLVQCTPTASDSESVQYKQNRSSLISNTFISTYVVSKPCSRCLSGWCRCCCRSCFFEANQVIPAMVVLLYHAIRQCHRATSVSLSR